MLPSTAAAYSAKETNAKRVKKNINLNKISPACTQLSTLYIKGQYIVRLTDRFIFFPMRRAALPLCAVDRVVILSGNKARSSANAFAICAFFSSLGREEQGSASLIHGKYQRIFACKKHNIKNI